MFDICNRYDLDEIEVSNISLFDTNPEYEVLKFEAFNPDLFRINAQLKEFPHTSNFPDYKAHLTIAYLKKGTGKKYVAMFRDAKHILIPTAFLYSTPSGKKHRQEI